MLNIEVVFFNINRIEMEFLGMIIVMFLLLRVCGIIFLKKKIYIFLGLVFEFNVLL